MQSILIVKEDGTYSYHVRSALTISNSAFCVYGVFMILNVNSDYFLKMSLNIINPFIFVMAKCIVLFEVRPVSYRRASTLKG
jgi:hypothetical protein